jgi:tRNA dimethylallyltransferase
MSIAKTLVVAIGGPTASGKSALALAVAEAFGGTVINADSMQVYRELTILTARPEGADLARAPHALYGVLPASARGSAAWWRTAALAEIETARDAGRLPVVVGGTGLYLRALMNGLAEIPPVPEAVREEARRRFREVGGPAFRAELVARDPDSARLDANDATRLTRAWEVVEATGRPLSEWQRESAHGAPGHLRFLTAVLTPPREPLYAACDRRFGAMMERGALEEARALDALGLDPDLPAMKALGVPELRRFLAGEWTLEQAVDKARQTTRNYAKRQLTWFRHQLPASPGDAQKHGSHSYLSLSDGTQSDVILRAVEHELRDADRGGQQNEFQLE